VGEDKSKEVDTMTNWHDYLMPAKAALTTAEKLLRDGRQADALVLVMVAEENLRKLREGLEAAVRKKA
jgi:hypothetical protein